MANAGEAFTCHRERERERGERKVVNMEVLADLRGEVESNQVTLKESFFLLDYL
jgi:hypothetical protein